MEAYRFTENRCSITGLIKNTEIHFYLDGKLIGESKISRGSMAESRILAAKGVGVEYYDRFIISPNGKFPADSLNCIIDGKPVNDYKQFENKLCQSIN